MKIIFFLLIYFLWIKSFHYELILHETNDNQLDFDCLYYDISSEKSSYQELSNVINDLIPYCIRPKNPSREYFRNCNNTQKLKMNFEELNRLNLSIKDLFYWSIPIDLIEKYEIYLNEKNHSLSTKSILNCPKPWFGIECQYSFSFNFRKDIFFNDIIENEFSNRISSIDSSEDILSELTCYEHIECRRGSQLYCLDWREICNGYIDCFDDGLDEKDCFEMEINECKDDEYRCHNGLCIPYEYWQNGFGEADCLDRSDEIADVLYPSNCYRDPRFRCEEHSCRTNWYDYPCGDGQCVHKFDQCHNGRHRLLINSINQQEKLDKKCFIVMMCLTKLLKTIENHRCEQLFINEILFENYLKTCKNLFQFPSIPIDFHHIYFLYENVSLKSKNQSLLIYPDYICFNQQFCQHFQVNFLYENLTCFHRNQIDLISSISGKTWIDIILSIDVHFRSCFIQMKYLNNFQQYENLSSLYRCENSSKLISKSRILDENLDCYYHDDEIDEFSCLINTKNHLKCSNENKCLSLIHTIDDCLLNKNIYSKQIHFRNLCNGLKEILYQDFQTKEILTDESNCEHWPCENLYSRCDGIFSCPNGDDEFNCTIDSLCLLNTHPCLSKLNQSLICLSTNRINDGFVDCLGGTDEIEFCKRVYPSNEKVFHCEHSDICLSFDEICNGIVSCPNGDDELFCQQLSNQTNFQKIFSYLSKNKISSYSLETTNQYPSMISQSTNFNRTNQSKNSNRSLDRSNEKQNQSWPWFCNRGLLVYLRKHDNQIENVCLCPPSYYGTRCQYQNQRVSLTLGLVRAKNNEIYLILIFLISFDEMNEEEEIDSIVDYKYISSETCLTKLNRYLLYSDRPKNQSKLSFIRINIYEKQFSSYRGSWLISIPFRFLPVNRLSTMIYIREQTPKQSLKCLNQCLHGQCFQYENSNQSFCHCYSGWQGIRCNFKVNNSQQCSNSSLSFQLKTNQTKCLCSMMNLGPHCQISFECPTDYCFNQGQCILKDLTNSLANQYKCLCPNQYYGSRCQLKKYELDILIEDLPIPSYILAYFFRLRDSNEPEMTILIEKLTLFQFQVRFYIRIGYHIVLIKLNEKYYLSIVQKDVHESLSTKINPSRECLSIDSFFNFTQISQIERMKSYHLICKIHSNLECFYDENHLCLCTKDSYANCFEFNQQIHLECLSKKECFNDGKCFQDHPYCPSRKICVCKDCFFGSQCQFYAKGLGLTLDEILTYEIQLNKHFFSQSLTIQLSGLLTILFFLIGLLNSIFSIIIFREKLSQEVGSGIYLLCSSIISLNINLLFLFKYFFLIYSYKTFFAQQFLIYSNCLIIEPILKLFVYINNWLNVCIGCERAFTVFKGITFNKKSSRKLAKWICLIVFLVNFALIFPQIFYLKIYDDQNEKRLWCGIYYSTILYNYNSFLEFFHYFSPFLLNLFSSIFIIIGTAKQKLLIQNSKQIKSQLKIKFNQHKYLVISPILILILSFPRLILSFTLNCQKSTKFFWLYLLAYQFSFFPSIFIFCLFVLPSPTYQKQFQIIFKNVFLFKTKPSNNNNNNKSS